MQDARVSSRSREHSKVKTMMRDLFAEELDALHARSLDRHLREITGAQGSEIEIAGRRFINFSSNDYLGLANDPRLREAATAAIAEFGFGAGASRLISGTQSSHLRLERALTKWKGTEAALCFSSGYSAALGTIPALVIKNDVVLLDKLCHASLIDGAKLSGAVLRVFPHNHMGKLERHLEWALREYAGKRILVVTESVFSMDGDHAPLRDLFLPLDLGHFNSANKCRTPNVQRPTSNENAGSAIFPWIVGDEQTALDLSSALQSEAFLVPAIRYPTVAKGTARLRITVTASHQEDQVRSLCEAIKRLSA